MYNKFQYPNKNTDSEDSDFNIRPLKKMRLIDHIDGLDDECEFEQNMFNFGDYDNLPQSDQAADHRCRPN